MQAIFTPSSHAGCDTGDSMWDGDVRTERKPEGSGFGLVA